jgi:hypothetical protein
VETHGRESHLRRRGNGAAAAWRGGLVAALALAALLVAGCAASGGGGINFSLGLQGATNDHPATPPQIASGGPDREYAFVYDNQVWVRQKGADKPRQVTQLTLSAGADITWGPLVWSHSGNSLAFALAVNLTPGGPGRAAGPIYYVDLSQCLSSSSIACATYRTPLTGSVYGHSYVWFQDDLLIAGGGAGISAYDLHDPNGPRLWQLRKTQDEQQDGVCQQPSAYGDVQMSGTDLYYTCMTLPGLGKSGAIGAAYLNHLSLLPIVNAFLLSDPVQRDQQIANFQNADNLVGSQLASLGNVYSDPQGNPVAGAWIISGDSTVAYEMIGSVDAKAGVASRTICLAHTWNGFIGSCGQQTLSAVGKQPLAVHAQISLGPNDAVAYQGAKLYATKLSNPLATTSTYAPQWASGDTLLVTSVLSTSTDASGVTRQKTSVQMASGSTLTGLISGASDLSLH